MSSPNPSEAGRTRSLHFRTLAVFGSLLLVLVVLIGFAGYALLKENVSRLEERAMDEHLVRLRTSLQDSFLWIGEIAKREAERIAESQEEATPGLRLAPSGPRYRGIWLAELGERMAEPAWVRTPDSATPESIQAMTDLLRRELAKSSRLLPLAGSGGTVSGPLNSEGNAFLYTAQSVLGSGRWVLALRPLDRETLNALAHRLLLNVSAETQPFASADANTREAIAHPQAQQIAVLSERRIAGYASIPDISGIHPIVFRVETDREIYQSGLRLVYLLVFGVSLAGIIVALAGWQIIDRWVVARVRTLQNQVGALARGTDLSHRLELRDQDEFSDLAGSINRLLDALSRRTDELGAEIQERVKVQQRLSDANRELQSTLQFRQDLSNMLVHDIRSPLTVIDFFLQIQARKGGAAAAKDQSLALAMKSVTRLNLMINDLLIMAKFEAGKVSLNRSTFDIRSALSRNIDEMRFLAQKRHVEIREELGENPLLVNLDANLLWRVVENLLTNAVKYSPDQASIEVRVHQQTSQDSAEEIILSVTDQGPGIPVELHETIFEKWNVGRLDRSKLQIGLGLSFCRMIVEAQGGRIWVENNLPTGSIFRVALPSANAARTETLEISGS